MAWRVRATSRGMVTDASSSTEVEVLDRQFLLCSNFDGNATAMRMAKQQYS